MTKTSILFLCLFAFITTGNCKECKACYDSICINLTRFSACQELKCIITCDTIIAQFTDLTHECNSNSQLIVCNFHYNRLFNFVNDLFFQNRNSFFIVNDKNEDFSYCSEFDFIDITISHNDSYEERYHIELDHGILKQEKMYYIWDRKIIFSSIFIEFVNLLYEMFPSNNSDGLDWYDSQARMYDPLLGRTPTMDPLSEKYYSISPYAWCAGNPVYNIDPDGNIIRTYIDGIAYDYQLGKDGTYGFYNQNGELYNGPITFVYDLTNSLQILQEGRFGKMFISDIINSENIATICYTKESNSTLIENNTINWDPDNLDGGISWNFVNGYSKSRPSYIGLGHELAHISDAWFGNYDETFWFKFNNNASSG